MKNEKKRRSQAQKEADARYQKKTKTISRIPAFSMSEEEDELLCELAFVFGSKKAAVINGLMALKNYLETKKRY